MPSPMQKHCFKFPFLAARGVLSIYGDKTVSKKDLKAVSVPGRRRMIVTIEAGEVASLGMRITRLGCLALELNYSLAKEKPPEEV